MRDVLDTFLDDVVSGNTFRGLVARHVVAFDLFDLFALFPCLGGSSTFILPLV
jgi:hypothetical protein